MSASIPAAIPHRLRLWAILIATLLDIAALIALRLDVAPEVIAEVRPLVDSALYAVLGLLVLGLGDAYMVERRRRTPGIPALPDDDQVGNGGPHIVAPLPWPPPPTPPDPPRRSSTLIEPATPFPPPPPDPPVGGAGLALVLVVLAAALSVATSGCGAGAFEMQVQIAAAAEDTAAETRELVRTFRTDAMRAAARAVYEAGIQAVHGLPEEERAAAAQALIDRATEAARAKGAEIAPLVEAQRLYALASHGYVDALDLADGNTQAESVRAASRGVLDAYRHLRRLGAELGVDELASLPATPSWLDGLIPPQLLAPETAQEGGAR